MTDSSRTRNNKKILHSVPSGDCAGFFTVLILLLCPDIQVIVNDTGFAVLDADVIAQVDDTAVGYNVIEYMG